MLAGDNCTSQSAHQASVEAGVPSCGEEIGSREAMSALCAPRCVRGCDSWSTPCASASRMYMSAEGQDNRFDWEIYPLPLPLKGGLHSAKHGGTERAATRGARGADGPGPGTGLTMPAAPQGAPWPAQRTCSGRWRGQRP